MNTQTTFVSSSINDPNFLYILAGQILLFVVLCAAVGWLTNKVIAKYKPGLKPVQRLALTITIVIALVCIVGYVSELLGL